MKKIFLLLIVLGLGFIFRPQTETEAWPVYPVGYSETVQKVEQPAPVVPAVQPSRLTALTNEWRTQNNLPALIESPLLNKSAELKCLDMQTKNYWSHNSPDGTSPWVFFKQADYSYAFAGENLAKEFDSPEEDVNGWRNSPTHNENLLSLKYTEVGFATCDGPQDNLVVQHLGKPITR